MPNQYSIVPWQERLWSRYTRTDDPDSCWIWAGSRDSSGYGLLSVNRRQCKTNRLAWEYTYGPIPEGMCVCHKCDNPACINPAHLWLGTHQDNMADRKRKGRGGAARGEANPKARCTEEMVRQMRALYAQGWRISKLVREFGMSRTVTDGIVKGRVWRHVK